MSTFTLAHLSDIHFGKIAHEGIVGALVEEVNALNVDLVAISGDLTQRARDGEFAAASDMIDAMHPHVLVVPGNHDVYAWWHPIRRIFHPLDRFRRHISDEPAPSFEADGVAVLGLNSAYGRTIKGGRIATDARDALSAYFAGLDASVFKVVVVHHHLSQIKALGSHDIVRNASDTLERAGDVGVDLVLCGHLHVSHIEPLEIIPDERRLVIASAGTATSSRGRGKHRETNFYNVVKVEADAFTVEERRYVPETDSFESDCVTEFRR
ncbi:MAG: metallophosphoesterase [Rhodothermales bacterium]